MAVTSIGDGLGNPITPTNPLSVTTSLLPIMAQPSVVQNALGTGAAITYSIVPINASGQDGTPSPQATVSNNAATPNNTVNWTLVSGADGGYKVLKNGNFLAQVGPQIATYNDAVGATGSVYTQNTVTTLAPVAVPGSPSAQSQSAAGTATAPAGGAAVATLTAPGAGSYNIEVTAGFGTTVDIFNNLQLKVGATVIGPVFMTTTANGLPTTTRFRRVNVPAATNVTVNAIGAGAGGSVYNALIVATPIN